MLSKGGQSRQVSSLFERGFGLVLFFPLKLKECWIVGAGPLQWTFLWSPSGFQPPPPPLSVVDVHIYPSRSPSSPEHPTEPSVPVPVWSQGLDAPAAHLSSTSVNPDSRQAQTAQPPAQKAHTLCTADIKKGKGNAVEPCLGVTEGGGAGEGAAVGGVSERKGCV